MDEGNEREKGDIFDMNREKWSVGKQDFTRKLK